MGFGTLFIGYFLLLNLTYSGFTDVIAAAVMLLGLYKLSGVNKQFKQSMIAMAVFFAFSLGEFGISTYELFMGSIGSPAMVSLISIARCWIIATFTFFMLKGIEAVAKEVDVEGLPAKASRLSVCTIVIYSAWIILEAPLSFIPDIVLAFLSLITILATIVLIIANLTVIYSAYMRICMPGDEELKDKPSRFAFVNEYRARKEERDREEAARRAKAMRERMEKRKGQKK